jgi:hypothetical protein
MFKATIYILIPLLTTQVCLCQTKVQLKNNICGWSKPLSEQNIYTWDANNQALEYVKKICDAAFIDPNFIIKRANVDNAIATIDDNNNRVIYYSESFFQSLNNEAYEIAILAHEIGHHINNHTFSKNDKRASDELIADQFAGSILCKLRLKLNDAKQLLNEQCSTQGDGYYPPRSARIEAVVLGFERCENFGSSKTKYYAQWSPADLQHGCGHVEDDIHITYATDDCSPYDDKGLAGYSTYGPYIELPTGDYMITWEIALVKDKDPDTSVTQLQVQDFSNVKILAQQYLYYSSFQASDKFQKISLNFRVVEDRNNDKFEFRVVHFANGTIKLKGIYLKKFN